MITRVPNWRKYKPAGNLFGTMNAAIITIASIGWLQTAAATDVPLPEHPRPNFQRPGWVNLNGPWQFEFDPEDKGLKAEWFKHGRHNLSRQIIVPFPWESRLSGIGDTEYKGAAWYSRDITIPTGNKWQDRNAWLVVGACDWQATVWVDGKLAREHIGGYTPFDINLSQFAKPGQKINITIRAVDITDPQQPTGKQIGWYTRTSGIWQTVYLEPRPPLHIQTIRGTPDIQTGEMSFEVAASQLPDGYRQAQNMLTISSPDGAFEKVTVQVPSSGTVAAKIKVKEPKLWSPVSPTLYPIVFKLARSESTDYVRSYFGLREISTAKAPGRDYQYIYLNGKPVYLRGALHQSFHPEGIYQYPNDASVRRDYELCKELGLNFLRIHIKAPVPRELFWADKLGILIMQDMPNTWTNNPTARKHWQATFEQTLQRDCNNPAVFAWCLFNETWGLEDKNKKYTPDNQKWVEQMYHLAKKLDPTRLIEENSPCKQDHVITDIHSWHFYINDFVKARDHLRYVVSEVYPGSTFNYIGGRKQGNAPLINSEYGGISAGLGDQDISWCFKYLTNEMRKYDKICGYIYTELSDIEWEHNGFVNYDRSCKEYGYDFWHPGFSVKDINNPDFIVIDTPPCIEFEPGYDLTIPIKISHWSERRARNLKLRYRVIGYDQLGDRQESMWRDQSATWTQFQVVDQPAVDVTDYIYDKLVLGAVLFELIDGNKTLARNYVNILRKDRQPPTAQMIDEETAAQRFSPADFAEWTFKTKPPKTKGIAAHKVSAQGTGAVEYHVKLHEQLDIKQIKAITVMAELAAKAGDEKLDWPARKKKHDYPQTDNKKWPTDVTLSLNGIKVATETLPDDPADIRGVLSHINGYKGSYGYLTKETVEGAALNRIINKLGPDRILCIRWEVPANAKNPGGLAVFGQKLGCYPIEPTVLFKLKK